MVTKNLINAPSYETTQTTVTASNDPELAWMTAELNPFGYGRRVYLTQVSSNTIGIGHALFLVAGTTNVPATGHIVVVEPFLTASNVANSCCGFAAQSASGNAMIWMQVGGCGTVKINGTGATASYSHGQRIQFNSDSGFIVTGGVMATTDAVIWARMAATGSVNAASAGTMNSASTDTKTVECFIMQNRWPFGGY